ncbi:MAG: GAF domain-containing protein, partial [Nitrospirae bacterium]|nr:GAF domain-containing protein [Nitrospirota bacterium]
MSRLYTDTLRGLAAFKRMADTLSGTSDVREICDRVVQIFAEELILEYCSIMLLDDEGEWLTLQSGIGPHVRRNKPPPHGIHTQGRVFRVGEGVAGRAARTRQPILISDVRKDDRFVQIDSPISIRSILCLPMISGENVVGVINLSHPEVGFFNEHYLRVFSILATTVGHIVGFARQEKRLEELNRTLEDRVAERTKEIREYKDYLENLLENASDLIFTLDKAGRVLFVNRRIDDLGYGRGDVIQRPFKTFLRDAEEGRMIRRFLDKKQKAAIEIPLRSSQGAVEEYLCSFSPLHDTHGTFLGTLVIGKSVAEKKRFERKLAQAEKLASLGELVAGIAHELNNKLVPILAYSELLQLSPMGERDLKMVRTITDAALGAKSVVESLLGFARQEKPKKEKISLNDVMTNTLTVFKYRLKTEGIDLNLALDRSLPRTLADYRQMEQVFLNLVKNAVQSMEGTGGTLTIRSSRADELIQFDVIDEDIRPVLHHEGGGEGDGPGAFPLLRDRQRARGRDVGVQPAGGDGLFHPRSHHRRGGEGGAARVRRRVGRPRSPGRPAARRRGRGDASPASTGHPGGRGTRGLRGLLRRGGDLPAPSGIVRSRDLGHPDAQGKRDSSVR